MIGKLRDMVLQAEKEDMGQGDHVLLTSLCGGSWFTPDEARELARLLLNAAHEAEVEDA